MTDSNTWYENEDFWHVWGPLMFSTQRIASTPGEIDQILALTQIPPGSHILDLCCGVGRHSLELARRGFKVTSIDRSEEYLQQAREQAQKEGLSIKFIRDDMRNFSHPDTYNLVINLYTSFGYFESQNEDQKVASNIYRSLKTDGLLVMEMSSKEVLARVFRERDWREVDGFIWLEERKIINDWSQIQTRWITFKGNRRYDHMFKLRLYSAVELRALLQAAGFAESKVYGGLDGIPYDHNARRLVTLGLKG
jgi:SAM-dependent methyltransferase